MIKPTGNPAKIRQLNRRAVLNYVRTHGLTSRPELIKDLNLSPATMSVVVGDLIAEGLIVEEGLRQTQQRNPGRPSKEIKLNPSAAYVFGLLYRIERKSLFIDTSWCDYAGNVHFVKSYEYPLDNTFEHVYEISIDVINTIINILPSNANIIGCGIGIPGVIVDDEIVYSPNLECIEGQELFRQITNYLDYPVYLENDVNLMAISQLEQHASLRAQNFSYLYLSQGIGSGTALQDDIWRSSGWAGEIGHLEVPFRENETKPLEWLLGLEGFFAEKLNELGISLEGDRDAIKQIAELPSATAVFDSYIYYMTLGIQVLNATFDLDVVVLGARNTSLLDYCMPKLTEALKQSVLKIRVIPDPNSLNNGACGASTLALRHSISQLNKTTGI